MNKMKVLNSHDIKFMNRTYTTIEQKLIKLNEIVSKYHCRFETGYGWRQNLVKLNDLKVISNDLYDLVYEWFDINYTEGQVVPIKQWEKYCSKGTLIQQEIENLIKEHVSISY